MWGAWVDSGTVEQVYRPLKLLRIQGCIEFWWGEDSQDWIKVVGRGDDWLPKKYTKICSKLFGRHMIRNNLLLPIGGHRLLEKYSLLLSVLIFVTNLFDNCIVLCLPYSIFFDKFIGLKFNLAKFLNKSLPTDFYAMFLTLIEFVMIISSLILWV